MEHLEYLRRSWVYMRRGQEELEFLLLRPPEGGQEPD